MATDAMNDKQPAATEEEEKERGKSKGKQILRVEIGSSKVKKECKNNLTY